jgi:hypothetical protein
MQQAPTEQPLPVLALVLLLALPPCPSTLRQHERMLLLRGWPRSLMELLQTFACN